jgi:hypothetical protein
MLIRDPCRALLLATDAGKRNADCKNRITFLLHLLVFLFDSFLIFFFGGKTILV